MCPDIRFRGNNRDEDAFTFRSGLMSGIRILMVSAECAPFAKSGGLGDVVGALPQFLVKAGHKVNVVMPLYSQVDRRKHNIVPAFEKLDVPFGHDHLSCGVYMSVLPGKVPVYL